MRTIPELKRELQAQKIQEGRKPVRSSPWCSSGCKDRKFKSSTSNAEHATQQDWQVRSPGD
jgi:hypothetical protein